VASTFKRRLEAVLFTTRVYGVSMTGSHFTVDKNNKVVGLSKFAKIREFILFKPKFLE